jgi:hypothetical protein
VRRGERNNRVNARPPPPPPPHRLRLSLPFRPSPSPHRTAPDSSAAPCQLCGAVAPLTPAAIVLCICFTTAEDLDPARTPPLPRLPFLSRAGPTTESTRLLPDAPASPVSTTAAPAPRPPPRTPQITPGGSPAGAATNQEAARSIRQRAPRRSISGSDRPPGGSNPVRSLCDFDLPLCGNLRVR